MEKTNSSMDMNTETLCRACAKTCNRRYAINSNICNFSTTIKDMIVLLVPQMETELVDNDVVCNICRKTLIHCVRFIDKCLRVEADRKDVLGQKQFSSDIAPSTNLKDSVIKKEVDNLIDIDKEDNIDCSLNECFNNDEEIDQVLNLKSENDNVINDGTLQNDNVINDGTLQNDNVINDGTLQNDLVEELPSSILNHNRFISAKQIHTDKLNEFIRIVASNDVRTIQFSQYSGRTTEHKRVILIGSTFKCKKCYKYLDSEGKYTRHLRGHTKFEQRQEERKRMRRLIRIQKIEKKRAQKLGIQMNGPKRTQRRKTHVDLECKTCLEKLSSIEDLELHLKIHPPFVCEKCGKGFAKRQQMYAHRSVHNDQNSYVCEVCGKALKTKSQLRQHAFIHENTVHACKKCPKVFKTALNLKAHMRNTHSEGPTRIWTCKECGKIFKRAYLHQIHYRQIHLRDGHKKCDVCGQGFYRSDYLTRHKKRHMLHVETEDPLNKDVAKSQTNKSVSNDTEKIRRYTFLPPGTLKEVKRRGRKTRLPPGPFQCQICKKFSKSLNNLKLHILSHGKARFSCKSCSRTFKIKYLLTRHEKVHQKPDLSVKYRCEICWKRFEIQEDLDQHYITHSNLKHKCELCEESFAREHLLKDHIANIHTEDDDEEEELRTLMTAGLGTTLYNLINMT